MQSREKNPDSTSYFDDRYLSSASNINRFFNSEKKSIDHPTFRGYIWVYALLPFAFSLMEYFFRANINNYQDTFSAIRNMAYFEQLDKTKICINMLAIYTILFLLAGLSEIDAERAILNRSVRDELFLLEQAHNIDVMRLEHKIARQEGELMRSTSIYEDDRRVWVRDRDAYIKQISELLEASKEKLDHYAMRKV